MFCPHGSTIDTIRNEFTISDFFNANVFRIEDKIHDEEVGVNGKLNYRGKREN